VRLTAKSTLADIALTVGARLQRHGITAVLTGGACVSVYTDGSYVSKDADYVLQGTIRQSDLDTALAALGFARRGDRYVHAVVPFYLEFPPGPLAIGTDIDIQPVEVTVAGGSALLLSPTDSCRDRLAAFYHWQDRQSLSLAVAIARHQAIDLAVIREWSRDEGSGAGYEEFLRELRRDRRANPPERRSRRAGPRKTTASREDTVVGRQHRRRIGLPPHRRR
jgi:hypothetical protein